jgi:hypothetical protein
MIPNLAEMNEFLRVQPDQNKAILEIVVYEKDASLLTRVYFNRVIIPAFQRGFKKLGDYRSVRELEIFIVAECPETAGKELEALGQGEMSILIDWAKQYAAENLGVCIEDSTYLNAKR